MILVSILASNNSIAPEDRRDQAETSEARNTKSVPKSWTVVQRVLVMRAGVTYWVLELVPLYTLLNDMDEGSFCDRKWHTRILIAFTA